MNINNIQIFWNDNFTPPQQSNNIKRIKFIDLAKGICILLVIAVHIPRLDFYLPGLNALRMPLYFILSGLFFKDYGSFFFFLEKKINKILLPFLFFFVIDLFHHAVLVKSFELSHFWEPIHSPFGIHNVPLWFLFALFQANILFCCIVLTVKSLEIRALTIIILGIIGYNLLYANIYLPFWMTQAINGLPYFYFGYLLRNTSILYPNKYDNYSIIFAFLCLSIGISICIYLGYTPRLDFVKNEIEQGWSMKFI